MAKKTDYDILNDLINANILVPIKTEQNRSCVVLEDYDDSTKELYKLKIKGVPSDSVVIKTDAFPDLQLFLECQGGKCCIADYAIISEQKKKILYIELKAKSDTNKHIINQLTGAQCLLFYCQNLGASFGEKDDFLKRYQHRFIAASHVRIRKKMRKEKLTKNHDRPNKLMKISYTDTVEFNNIA